MPPNSNQWGAIELFQKSRGQNDPLHPSDGAPGGLFLPAGLQPAAALGTTWSKRRLAFVGSLL